MTNYEENSYHSLHNPVDNFEIKSTSERQIFYDKNEDFNGNRKVKNNQETVSYQKNSTVRIWYNDLTLSYDTHRHSAIEIIMPIENWYDVETPNFRSKIHPGEIIVIPPGEMHKLTAPSSGSRFVFLIDVSFMLSLQGFTGIRPMLREPIHITPETHEQIYNDIYQLLVQIRTEYFSSSNFYELSIHAHLLSLFVLLGEDHVNRVDMYSGLNSMVQKEYMQRFNNVLNFINEHFTEDLTLEEVAACSGFSKFHFTRLFKKYTNSTFYDYLIYRRIQEAEKLLAEADLSITDVALYSGFSSISTFNRTFKQKKNCTPREYRAMCRNQFKKASEAQKNYTASQSAK